MLMFSCLYVYFQMCTYAKNTVRERWILHTDSQQVFILQCVEKLRKWSILEAKYMHTRNSRLPRTLLQCNKHRKRRSCSRLNDFTFFFWGGCKWESSRNIWVNKAERNCWVQWQLSVETVDTQQLTLHGSSHVSLFGKLPAKLDLCFAVESSLYLRCYL